MSAIVVTYNSERHVGDCVSSLEQLADDESIPLEIIVIDNGSSDHSLEVVAEASPRSVTLKSPGNVGFAAAANAGMARAHGDLILLLNPDCRYIRGRLTSAIEALEAQPHIGMLGCRLEKEDGTLDHACKRFFPTPWDGVAYFLRLGRVFKSSRRFSGYVAGTVPDDEASLVDAVNGAFMLIKRPVLAEVGPLDERYWMYGEDLDWCWRLRDRGYGVLYWPDLTFLHVKGASSQEGRPFRLNWAFHRAMWLFYRRFQRQHYSLATSLLVALGVGVRFILSATLYEVSRLKRTLLRGPGAGSPRPSG